MATYLRETIESVLSQDYPHIEYIVMDGGSTDDTLEVLKRYEGRLRYVSRPDRGTADAVNQGFQLARGSILAWLNADDTYLPGAVSTAVRCLLSSPELGGVYGEAYWVDRLGKVLGRYPSRPFDPELLSRECYICQAVCFFRREAFEQAGMLDPTLEFCFDYELWIRMSKTCRLGAIPEYLATSRMHRANKTLAQRRRMFPETCRVLKRHYGYVPFQWIFAYTCFLVDKRDQFYKPLRLSLFKYGLSLPVGCWYNWRRMGRYLVEWGSKMGPRHFGRYWNQTRLARVLGLRLRDKIAPPKDSNLHP
jgi:glycosyltransferase involved in cell wall biosynthesis